MPTKPAKPRAPAPPRPRPRAPVAQPWGLPAPPAPPVAPAAPQPPPTAPGVAPADAVARIQAVASKGGSLKGLHAVFGVTAEQLKSWMDDDPELRKAFDAGKELEREALHRTLYDAATVKRDLSAAQFLLKTRHGYRESEPEDTRNTVRIVFNLPAAAPDMKTYVEQNGSRKDVAMPRKPRVIDHE